MQNAVTFNNNVSNIIALDYLGLPGIISTQEMQKEKQLEHDNGAWVKARNITTDTGNPKTDKDNSALEACAMGQTIL